MTTVAFLVVIASVVALLVVGIEDIGSGHAAFANRGINVQTDTNQRQVCEPAGGTSGITNACTATSGRGSTETQVTLMASNCISSTGQINCRVTNCNNIGCQSVTCVPDSVLNCITDNDVQLTSCTIRGSYVISCTRTEPGTGITSSGGVTTSDAG